MFFKKRNNIEVDPADPNKEWRLIESILGEAFAEQRRARRWGVVFKSLTFLYLFGVGVVFYLGANLQNGGSAKTHVGVVRLEGVIAADQPANAGRVGAGLRAAFKNKKSKAVVVAINSPGGSPVQAGYIYDEMVRLKGKYPDKPLYAVIADIGASGGYYIAAAADEIYADKASLVGSIGVTASGFGFVDVMEKLGVERRHYTAGEHKAFLDPFSPIKEEEEAFWQSVLKNTHNQFVKAVSDGRGERLSITDEITSGLIWNGEQALNLGLIDGLGGVRYVARELVKEDKLKDYTPKDSPFKEILNELGVSVGKGISQAMQSQSTLKLQ